MRENGIVDRKATGEHIRALLRERDISMKEAAKSLRITYNGFHRYIQGICLPTLNHLLWLSELLEVKMSDILIIDKEKEREILERIGRTPAS